MKTTVKDVLKTQKPSQETLEAVKAKKAKLEEERLAEKMLNNLETMLKMFIQR